MNEICVYCGNEIRPLDSHVAKVEPDTQLIRVTGKISPTIIVSCVLKRIYEIKEIAALK